MPAPLLATKIFIPPPGACLVERSRLLNLMDGCLRPGCRLALLSAPAGFGKTTLASAWIRSAPVTAGRLAAAWVSLDEQDNDPNRFWSYVVAALQSANHQIGEEVQKLLGPGQISSAEPLITLLINDLAALNGPVILILDDFHLVEEGTILKNLVFLLDRIPPNFHIMIITRADPHLPLALYRSRGQLLEIRLANLRFSLQESSLFLNNSTDLRLSAQAVETLHAKTEGWAAGLQMAALALQRDPGQDEPTAHQQTIDELIAAFSGSTRFILDYLIEQVLQRQTDEIQTFLQKTSILGTFCSSLCAELIENVGQEKEQTEQPPIGVGDYQAILEYLERENLFLVPLDAERHWYRYHTLFADLLRKRLRKTDPAGERELHARASRWYQHHQYPQLAVEHAFQAQDTARTGQLLDDAGEAILRRGEYHWLLHWIEKLPREEIQRRWKLSLYQATVYASVGKLRQAEECLEDFERFCQADRANGQLEDWLSGQAAAVHAMIAIYRGDIAASRRYAQLALGKIPKGADSPWRAHLLIALSHLNRAEGNLEEARQNLIEAMEAGRLAGDIYMTLDASTHLVMLLSTAGQLRQASQFAEHELQYIEKLGLGSSVEASMLFLGWGYILCEQHRLVEAGEYIQRGLETAKQANVPGMLGWAYQVQIRCSIARGDWNSAEASAREGARLAKEIEVPLWIANGILALCCEVWIRQEKLNEAEQLLNEKDIYPIAQIDPEQYALYYSLGRLLLAKAELDQAERLVSELLQRAESKGMQRMVIAALIQLALLHQARGKPQQAVQTLERALEIAQPEGYIQIFLDEGQALADLLASAASQGKQAGFARELILLASEARPSLTGKELQSPLETQPEGSGEAGPLSQREIEVLRLLAEGLSNKEIAQRLYISLRTVKYHTTNIFTKLNVNSRTQAVFRAKEMRML